MRDEIADRVRTYGAINTIGLWTLFEKEVRRFLKVFIQTILAPIMQTVLFMAVLTLAWGDARTDMLGVPFAQFLAPGLVMMAVIGNAFANASSSLVVSKLQGNAVDFLMPPLSAAELTLAFVGGAAVRGLLVGVAGIAVVAPFASIGVANLWAILYFATVAAVMMGCVGLLAGLWAEKFDHLAAVTNFVITPLTFLSGTFYSIAILPGPLEAASRFNPFFHLIDGFRFGFIGAYDGSPLAGAVATAAVTAALVAASYVALRSGWRLKA